MRKLLTLSIVAVLSLFSTAAFADFSDELAGKKIAIGEALQTPADIQEGTWYVIATLYGSRLYDNMYMYDKYYSDSYDRLYFWDKNDAVYSGMDATDDDALRTLVRFVPVTVSGYDSDTYYLEFATGRRAYLYDNNQNNYVRLYLDGEFEQPVYAYNISDEPGHFGFYVASENQYRLYGGYSNGNLYITTWSTGAASTLNAQYDFAIYPAIAESEEDLLEAAYSAFVSTYEQYSALTWDTGTNPGQYSAESVAALTAALANVADLVGAGSSSKTADEWSELTTTLKEAYNAVLESQITTVDYADGQYFIEIAGLESETTYAVYPDAGYSYYYLDWGALDETNELHIWNVTAVGDGSYTVTNAYTNSTFNEFVTSSYDWATLSESSNIKMVFDYDHTTDAGEYVVKIRTSTNTKGYLWAAGVSNGKSGGYMWSWTGTDSGSYFKLVNINDDEAEDLIGYASELKGKKIAIGDALQTADEIEEGTWYVMATQYKSAVYENMYVYDQDYNDNYNRMYFWNKSDAVYDGMDATDEDALRTLVRFVPTTVSGFDKAYYMEFATGRMAYLYDTDDNYQVALYQDGQYKQPIYVYNVGDTDGHLGISIASSSNHRLYGGYSSNASRLYLTTWNTGNSSTLNGEYDFAIYPAIAGSDEEMLQAAYDKCVSSYEKYSVMDPQVGTTAGYYSEEAVEAFLAAVAAAEGCAEADPSSKTTEEWTALNSAMNSAYNDLVASMSTLMDFPDGEYYIELAGDYPVDYALYISSTESPTSVYWMELTTGSSWFTWDLTNLGEDTYKVVNKASNTTFGEFVTSGSAHVSLVEGSNIELAFEYDHTDDDGNYVMKIGTTTTSGSYLWAAGTASDTSGWIWSWYGSNSASYFKLVNVSDAEAEEFVDDEMNIDDEVVDGSTTYKVIGENLFVNGGFNDGVNGWKTIGYTTDAVIDNFTITETGGYNGGAYITTVGAGTGSEMTIRQSIAVEAGKPYLFIAYTSGETPAENNKRYNALLQMESATDEVSVVDENGSSQPVDIVTLEWGADAGETATEWTRTEAVFIAPTDYVGMRMGWNSNASFDAFQLYALEAETVHECEAEFDHWSLSGNTGYESFQRNTWSTEADESGMVTPFVEYWVYGVDGATLTDATISHTQLTDLEAGTYQVSIDARIFSEGEVDGISEGTTFNANGESVDLTTGTAAMYGTETEVYGTYTLTCEVGDEGTLDISFAIVNANFNWIAFKNLTVSYVGSETPEVEGIVPNGIYMLKNVEVGQYLGGGNAWGTQASMLTRPQQFTLEALSDGTYTLASYQYNGERHYLNGVADVTDLYCDTYADTDGTWTIAETDEEGVYTLSLGDGNYLTATEEGGAATTQTDPTAAGTTWQLITMADIVASQADATAENPVDVTGLIMNPTLNYASQATDQYWTVASYDDDTVAPSNSAFGTYRSGSNNEAACDVESYHSTNGFNIHQTLEGLTAGYYEFSAQGFYRDDSEDGVTEGFPELYAGDAATTLPDLYSVEGTCATGSQSMATAYTDFLAGLYPVSVQFVLDEDRDVTIGVRGSSTELWNIFGEINLTYYGTAGYPDVETGINSAAAAVENGAIYTIQGIRVSNMSQPGIYIQNGKKILVK